MSLSRPWCELTTPTNMRWIKLCSHLSFFNPFIVAPFKGPFFVEHSVNGDRLKNGQNGWCAILSIFHKHNAKQKRAALINGLKDVTCEQSCILVLLICLGGWVSQWSLSSRLVAVRKLPLISDTSSDFLTTISLELKLNWETLPLRGCLHQETVSLLRCH